jgi:hypothetical protein
MNKHTQGTWEVTNLEHDPERKYNVSIFSTNGKYIAQVNGLNAYARQTPEEIDANARLIAAAPDLLAAALQIIEKFPANNLETIRQEEAIRNLQNAINKATI